MTASKWRNAAKQYASKKSSGNGQASPGLTARSTDHAERVGQALHEFITSDEGRAAMALLAASRQFIRFGERYDGGGHGQVWFLDGAGFQRSTEAMGTWVAYSKEPNAPKIDAVNALEMAEVLVDKQRTCSGGNPIMDWLRGKLDDIAAAAPKR